MLSTSAQQLKDIGTFMGFEGPDLIGFIREQQKLEREKKDKKRQAVWRACLPYADAKRSCAVG